MTKEELDVQKEIEEYFTESAGFGRDKIQNFMAIVNKALKQKGERIAELESQIEKMKCCENCIHYHKEEDVESCWNCERQIGNNEEIIKDEWEIKEK